jgi:hypothetical protein
VVSSRKGSADDGAVKVLPCGEKCLDEVDQLQNDKIVMDANATATTYRDLPAGSVERDLQFIMIMPNRHKDGWRRICWWEECSWKMKVAESRP